MAVKLLFESLRALPTFRNSRRVVGFSKTGLILYRIALILLTFLENLGVLTFIATKAFKKSGCYDYDLALITWSLSGAASCLTWRLFKASFLSTGHIPVVSKPFSIYRDTLSTFFQAIPSAYRKSVLLVASEALL